MVDTGELLKNAAFYPGEIGGAHDFGESAGGGGNKVGLSEFVTHNHSLLAIWFSTQEEAPPVLLPCICCANVNVTEGLSRRQRIWIFSFVLVSILIITLQVRAYGWEPYWLWIWIKTMVIILPVTCIFKTVLPDYSKWLNQRAPPRCFSVVRVEEAALAAALLVACVWFAVMTGVYNTASVVADFFSTLGAMMVAEVVSLVWKYCCCTTCCSCCLPPGQGHYRERSV